MLSTGYLFPVYKRNTTCTALKWKLEEVVFIRSRLPHNESLSRNQSKTYNSWSSVSNFSKQSSFTIITILKAKEMKFWVSDSSSFFLFSIQHSYCTYIPYNQTYTLFTCSSSAGKIAKFWKKAGFPFHSIRLSLSYLQQALLRTFRPKGPEQPRERFVQGPSSFTRE